MNPHHAALNLVVAIVIISKRNPAKMLQNYIEKMLLFNQIHSRSPLWYKPHFAPRIIYMTKIKGEEIQSDFDWIENMHKTLFLKPKHYIVNM